MTTDEYAATPPGPDPEPDGVPWRPLLALALLGGLIALVVVYWHRVYSDFWPVDRSFVGPNLVASVIQWAVIFIFVALLYPPFRKWLRTATDEVLHRHLEHHREVTADQRAAELAEIHAKIDAHHAEHMATLERHHKSHLAAVRKIKETK